MVEGENGETKKVAVLLERHGEETRWTATVPQVDGVIAEGESVEEATQKIQVELQEVIDKYSEMRNKVIEKVEFFLTEVKVRVS